MWNKLENIYQNLILENKRLLLERPSEKDIIDAIDSDYRYRVWYQGEREEGVATGLRFCDFYVLGISKAGNEVVRVYQGGGYSTSDSIGHGWKLFRTDRIRKIEKTKQHVGKQSIDKYDKYDKKCGNCIFFKDGGCELVNGVISPVYVCNKFKNKTEGFDDIEATEHRFSPTEVGYRPSDNLPPFNENGDKSMISVKHIKKYK
jgi:hypothetical protein